MQKSRCTTTAAVVYVLTPRTKTLISDFYRIQFTTELHVWEHQKPQLWPTAFAQALHVWYQKLQQLQPAASEKQTIRAERFPSWYGKRCTWNPHAYQRVAGTSWEPHSWPWGRYTTPTIWHILTQSFWARTTYCCQCSRCRRVEVAGNLPVLITGCQRCPTT